MGVINNDFKLQFEVRSIQRMIAIVSPVKYLIMIKASKATALNKIDHLKWTQECVKEHDFGHLQYRTMRKA